MINNNEATENFSEGFEHASGRKQAAIARSRKSAIARSRKSVSARVRKCIALGHKKGTPEFKACYRDLYEGRTPQPKKSSSGITTPSVSVNPNSIGAGVVKEVVNTVMPIDDGTITLKGTAQEEGKSVKGFKWTDTIEEFPIPSTVMFHPNYSPSLYEKTEDEKLVQSRKEPRQLNIINKESGYLFTEDGLALKFTSNPTQMVYMPLSSGADGEFSNASGTSIGGINVPVTNGLGIAAFWGTGLYLFFRKTNPKGFWGSFGYAFLAFLATTIVAGTVEYKIRKSKGEKPADSKPSNTGNTGVASGNKQATSSNPMTAGSKPTRQQMIDAFLLTTSKGGNGFKPSDSEVKELKVAVNKLSDDDLAIVYSGSQNISSKEEPLKAVTFYNTTFGKNLTKAQFDEQMMAVFFNKMGGNK